VYTKAEVLALLASYATASDLSNGLANKADHGTYYDSNNDYISI
jgi:hypothetical protein